MGYVIYNTATHPDPRKHGQIALYYEGPKTAAEHCVKDHQGIIEGDADPATDYVNLATGTVATRQDMGLTLSKDQIAADGLDEAIISGLPIPYTAYVNGEAVLVDDGTLELSSESAGVIHVTIGGGEYVQQGFTIYAT